MTRFTLAVLIGSTRRLLAVVTAVLAVAGTAYLSSHKLSNPDHYAYGVCGSPSEATTIIHQAYRCMPPTRAGWQIPLAVVIAGLGFGAAVAAAGPRHRPEHESVLGGLGL